MSLFKNLRKLKAVHMPSANDVIRCSTLGPIQAKGLILRQHTFECAGKRWVALHLDLDPHRGDVFTSEPIWSDWLKRRRLQGPVKLRRALLAHVCAGPHPGGVSERAPYYLRSTLTMDGAPVHLRDLHVADYEARTLVPGDKLYGAAYWDETKTLNGGT